jgi:hypothetical protein
MGALNPEWVVVMRSSRDFPCLDLFLGDTDQSERFLPWRGAHWCVECPGLDLLDMTDMLEQVYGEVVT